MIAFVVGAVMSIVLHEYAHAQMAYECGDTTAKRAGRLTLNPFAHLHPVYSGIIPLLTWALFGVVIGMARPVPVSYGRLSRRAGAAVALAGPAMSGILALLLYPLWRDLALFNAALVAFNLLPIPPLDGYRVWEALST